MANYHPVFPEKCAGTVFLPASKSISARALVLGALAGGCHLRNLSDCDDTRVLQRALALRLPEIDIMAAGTAMRFSTAYFSTCVGEEHVITGTERMCQRPIRVLVDALRELGADIDYLGAEGYPPLRVHGRNLHGGTISLSANVSSQYISALLMIGPTLQDGLTVHLSGEIVSRPYIDMTLNLMRKFGAQVEWRTEGEIVVLPVAYRSGLDFEVEPDWSAASYWYEIMALTADPAARIFLPSLTQDSCQGDSIVARLFSSLGVQTSFTENGAVLTKSEQTNLSEIIEWNLDTCPDLAQTLVVTCALLGQPFRFSGLQSLRIKETDRIDALLCELKKLGIEVNSITQVHGDKRMEILEMVQSQSVDVKSEVVIDTYEDHRMAMAFAPAAICCPHVAIAHPEVVSKSYPAYWKDLENFTNSGH